MLIIKDKEFARLSEYIKSNYGINLKPEKKSLIAGRLHKILLQGNFTSFEGYFEHVLEDETGEAMGTLINKLTTNHTFFMREPEHFTYFKKVVLPYLEAAQNEKKDLRIWSAGCSSGEEPYTLAMLMDDFFGSSKKLWDTRILATDISTRVLEKAVKGIYSAEETALLPPSWKMSYFRKISGQQYEICPSIRDEVIFRKLNLNVPRFPFAKRLHVIFCRNVMIYFDGETKRELINKFYELTEPGGYLFIGCSESIGREESKYRHVMPAVYRKE